MAALALNCFVGAGERKRSLAMIKGGRLPGLHVMTACAVMIEVAGDVIRFFCFRERSFVTRVAVGRCAGVAGGMAFLALNLGVRSLKWERSQIVVKLCR